MGYLVGTGPMVYSHCQRRLPPYRLSSTQKYRELQHFFGLVQFYRKFIPFFANVTACLNTMLQKGAVFKWTKQCNNVFNLLKSDLVKMPRLQYTNPNKPFKLFTDMPKQGYFGYTTSRGGIQPTECRA